MATVRGRPGLVGKACALLDHVVLLDAGWEVCERARLLDRDGVRSLDALHLAFAMMLADDLEGIVTYDARLGGAARSLGLTVVAPV